MTFKRITLLAGHYGSGKTNIAVNIAAKLKETRDRVAIADLDIVNPYFRTVDSRALLESEGIRLICSEYAGGNLDIPALPQDIYAVTDDKDLFAVMDIGGDDAGAVALGRYSASIVEENDYEMLYVVNRYRPLTASAADAARVMREIERAAGISFTAIVNNSNLGEETTALDVQKSLPYAKELSETVGLPIRFTSVKYDLASELCGKIDNIFELRLQPKIR